MKLSTFNATIIFVGTFLFSVSAFAQTSFFVGPMASGHLSSYEATKDFSDHFSTVLNPGDGFYYTVRQDLNVKPLAGISGGATFGVQFGKFALVSGARFYQKGAKFESRDFNLFAAKMAWYPNILNYDLAVMDIGTFKLTERQNFIHIPLLARYQVVGEEIGLTLALGPAFNIGVGKTVSDWTFEGQLEGVETDDSYNKNYGKNLSDFYKPSQTSFIISAGIVIPVGEQGKLNFNVNWETDLSTSVNENYRNQFLERPKGDQRNKSFGIGISYEHHLDFNMGIRY